jgi:hypothetical protein
MLLPVFAIAQQERTYMGKKYAEEELKSALSLPKNNDLLEKFKLIIPDSATSIAVAEPVLFNIYGKENILFEKPYESYLINNYWVILGSLPKGNKGGTFEIIIDAKNAGVLWISHDK